MANLYTYIGGAIRQPFTLESGRVSVSRGLDVLNASIMDILNTPKGSRLFLPEYGSRLQEALFEPVDLVMKALIRQFVKEALEQWERRVRFVDITFEIQTDRIDCTIIYKVLPRNEINSFVYPYYTQIIH